MQSCVGSECGRRGCQCIVNAKVEEMVEKVEKVEEVEAELSESVASGIDQVRERVFF